jgi:hypothetical protein
MRKSVFAAIGVLVVVAATSSVAQQGFVPPPASVRAGESLRATGPTAGTKVVGTILDLRRVPVAGARVQLRDLSTGRVEQETLTNENGEYTFSVASPNGTVAAVSNAGIVASDETLQTLMQLPGRWDPASSRVVVPPAISSYFGASGAQTITRKTLDLAMDQNITPADPGEPVSPGR